MSSSRALASQEREIQFVRLGRTAKSVLMLLATAMTFLTVILLVTDRLYRPDAFVINQLKLKGQFNHVTPKAVQDVVYAEPLGNFFSIELTDIKRRVESMSWVKHADVRREWPHTLVVHVAEHRPVLRWETIALEPSQTSKNVAEKWVSAGGKVISLEQPLAKESAMLLRGTEHDAQKMLAHAIRWQRQLAPSGMRIETLMLSPSQAWSLKVSHLNQDSQFDLLLGRSDVQERLQRFQALYEQQFKQAPIELIRVDARYPDGVAVHANEKQNEENEITDARSERIDAVLLDFNVENQPS